MDRSKHEQTIKVTDNDARSHWFGLVAGAVGLSAGAATKGLASAASRGSNISKVSVNRMRTGENNEIEMQLSGGHWLGEHVKRCCDTNERRWYVERCLCNFFGKPMIDQVNEVFDFVFLFIHSLQKKQDGEDISMLEIVQLSSSLFIFTHSVYNFQTATNIVKSAQKATIGEYRRGLSRNQQ